jgi:hypothetical protein
MWENLIEQPAFWNIFYPLFRRLSAVRESAGGPYRALNR